MADPLRVNNAFSVAETSARENKTWYAANMEERLVELEIRYTHLERQIAELDQVVFAQQKLIDGLAKELSAVVGRMGQFAETPPGEKPPHY